MSDQLISAISGLSSKIEDLKRSNEDVVSKLDQVLSGLVGLDETLGNLYNKICQIDTMGLEMKLGDATLEKLVSSLKEALKDG